MRLLAGVLLVLLFPMGIWLDRFVSLSTKYHLVELTSRLDLALDRRNWPTVESLFSDPVDLRVLRISTTVSRERFVGLWRRIYFPQKHVFHMTTNHIVELDHDRAVVTADGHIWNRLVGAKGGNEWEVWGVFRYGFVYEDGRWLIERYDFQPDRQVGNRNVATATSISPGGDLSPVNTEPVPPFVVPSELPSIKGEPTTQ